MPMDPKYSLAYSPGAHGHSFIGGVGYREPQGGHSGALVACAVCNVQNKSAFIMIPAKSSCPASWNKEYHGYLMSEFQGSSNSRYMYECVDVQMDSVQGYQSRNAG